MVTLDHLGESSILIFHISYIEDNACFKFGVLGDFPLFLNCFSSFNYPIFYVFFLLFVCFSYFFVFIVFRFLFFIFRMFLFLVELVLR